MYHARLVAVEALVQELSFDLKHCELVVSEAETTTIRDCNSEKEQENHEDKTECAADVLYSIAATRSRLAESILELLKCKPVDIRDMQALSLLAVSPDLRPCLPLVFALPAPLRSAVHLRPRHRLWGRMQLI